MVTPSEPGKAEYETWLSAVPEIVCNVPGGPWEELSPAVKAGFAAISASSELVPAARFRNPIVGLIGMWDGMRKVTSPSEGEWERWRGVLGGMVEELASLLPENAGEPHAAADQYVILRKAYACHPTAHGPYSEAEATRLSEPADDNESRMKLLLGRDL